MLCGLAIFTGSQQYQQYRQAKELQRTQVCFKIHPALLRSMFDVVVCQDGLRDGFTGPMRTFAAAGCAWYASRGHDETPECTVLCFNVGFRTHLTDLQNSPPERELSLNLNDLHTIR